MGAAFARKKSDDSEQITLTHRRPNRSNGKEARGTMSIPRSGILLLAACAGLGNVPRVAFAQHYPPGAYQELAWRMIGPFRRGRTRAVAGVPSQPGVFYIGAVNGGVWKTEDAGRTWRPIFDAQPTQSIGAIAVAPSDPNLIYVG